MSSSAATVGVLGANLLIGAGALAAAMVAAWTLYRGSFRGTSQIVSWSLWFVPWLLTLCLGREYLRRQFLLAFSGVPLLVVTVWGSAFVGAGLLAATVISRSREGEHR